MLVNDLKFDYSYLLINENFEFDIADSNCIPIGDWKLYTDDKIDVEIYQGNQSHLILLGYALDTRNSELHVIDILKNLSTVKDIDDSLSYINGRFVLILSNNEGIYIYTDASALLPINYSKDKRIVSSHDVLIKEILNLNGEEVKHINSNLKNSFDFTRYQNIYKFNPSLKLELNTYKFKRHYPNEVIKEMKIEVILEELEGYFNEMINWLKRFENKIILTLTGGFDSRVSMALTRSFNEQIEYITYIHPNLARLSDRAQEIYDTDVFITKNIASNININHTLVNLADYKLKGKQRDEALRVLQTTHSFPLIDYFRNKRQFNKVLHIKSTVFGMGKSDFPLNKNHTSTTKEEMFSFIHGVPKAVKEMNEYNEIIEDYYKRNLIVETVGKGRHFFDIFHLESRMGNWHSNVTQETDPELIDFVFVNTRRIIDLIQSPSIQERKDKVLYKSLIKKYWPALFFISVNEKEYNIDFERIGLKNVYINGLKIYELSNLSLEEKNNNEILIKPDSENVGPQNQYVFKAKNNTHYSKKIGIKSLFNKETGRNYINVKIMKLDNKTFKSIDIVDLFEGYEVILKPFQELMIRVDYNQVFNKLSWQNAGQIIISNI